MARATIPTVLARFAVALAAIGSASCLGSTGYSRVHFNAAAAGAADATAGQPYAFTSDTGFHVVLTSATLHVGALYLDQSVPTSGSQGTDCTLPGTYVGEVRDGLDVDLLSPTPTLFPSDGDGTTIPAAVGEVWLTGGDVTAAQDPTVILSLRGTADKDGKTFPFGASLTISSQNRSPAAAASALPGSNPICKQRIVTPILTHVTLHEGGTLTLRVEPKALFTNVDFTSLKLLSSDPPAYGFTDDDSNQASVNLYQNLRAAGAVYRFEWTP